ncbi:MAG: hypothetical protein Q9M26_08635 [Mariprofundales bacterium]|nr:hypothetical protein [Mariprofundales bacterium]
MMLIAAVGQGMHFQGIAVSINGVILTALTIYLAPISIIMVPAGIMLQNKPKKLCEQLRNFTVMATEDQEKNIMELRTICRDVSSYYDKVQAMKRNYFIRGEYHAMIAQREQDVQENNQKRAAANAGSASPEETSPEEWERR